jgi:hypothetical protein
VTVIVDETNFCVEVAEVACYNMFRCCTGLQIEEALGITISTTEPECRRDVELICEREFAEIIAAMEKGNVVFLTENAQPCLESLLMPTEDCFTDESELPWARWCEESPFRGVVVTGQECLHEFECTADSYCTPDRRCTALPQLQQPCPQGRCALGLYCDYETGRCASLKAVGSSCGTTGECVEGSFCGSDGVAQPTCQGKRSLGSNCTQGIECQTGVCLPGICSDGSECYEDEDCLGNCAQSGDNCASEVQCPGLCLNSQTVCESSYDCPGYVDCVHEDCLRQCLGQPVCAQPHTVVDYCQAAFVFFADIQD